MTFRRRSRSSIPRSIAPITRSRPRRRRSSFALIPDPLKPGYESFFRPDPRDDTHRRLVRAADKLCAYLKCLQETGAGNPEFAQAEKSLRASVEELDLPEVRYFLETFVPSFRLTLDELN